MTHNKLNLLYSWRFSRYSAPIHWLVHGHMSSNNETVSRQMPWAGNIAKTMTSNGKQCTVTREMLTAVARDRWNLSAVFKFCFCFVLLYNKSLNDWSLGQQWILFPSNLNVSLDFVSGNIEVLGKQNSLFPSGPVIKCLVHICNISAQMWMFLISYMVIPIITYSLDKLVFNTLAITLNVLLKAIPRIRGINI